MKHSVGLDVSVKETAICIVDESGKVLQETKVATEPAAIGAGMVREIGPVPRPG